MLRLFSSSSVFLFLFFFLCSGCMQNGWLGGRAVRCRGLTPIIGNQNGAGPHPSMIGNQNMAGPHPSMIGKQNAAGPHPSMIGNQNAAGPHPSMIRPPY
jgi:hypothetical protein